MLELQCSIKTSRFGTVGKKLNIQNSNSCKQDDKDETSPQSIYPHVLLLNKHRSSDFEKKECVNIWDPSFSVTNKSIQNLASQIFREKVRVSKSGRHFMRKRLSKFPRFLKKLVSTIRRFECPKTQKYNISDFVNHFLKVLPMETFGSVENRSKVILAYVNFFTMSRYDKVDIDCLLGNLSARRIKWLSFTQTHEFESLVAAQKLIHTFFQWLLFEVLARKVFSVFRTEVDPSNSHNILYRGKNAVMKFQRKALSFYVKPPMQLYKQIKKKDTEKLLAGNKILGVSKLKFSRKEDSSSRPIVKHGEMCFTKELDIKQSVNCSLEKLKQFFAFLQHSWEPAVCNGCSVRGGPRDEILTRKLAKYFATVKNPVIYYVKADIQKCYDSIDQEKMCRIVNRLFDKMDQEKFAYQKILMLQGKRFFLDDKKKQVVVATKSKIGFG